MGRSLHLPGCELGGSSAHHGAVALADDDDGFPGRYEPAATICCMSSCPTTFASSTRRWPAYRRELEAARRLEERRRRWRHRFLPEWARGGLPSPVFTAVLLVIATTGLLLSVFAPVTQERQHSTPIAALANPKTPPGTVGGLLPDVQLVTTTNPIDTRMIRPAVYVLVPAGCKCASQLREIISQVNEVPPPPDVLIVSKGTDATSTTLANALDDGRGSPIGVRDLNGVLASTYHASATAPTLLLEAGDGTLSSRPHVFHTGDRLEPLLAPLHF